MIFVLCRSWIAKGLLISRSKSQKKVCCWKLPLSESYYMFYIAIITMYSVTRVKLLNNYLLPRNDDW